MRALSVLLLMLLLGYWLFACAVSSFPGGTRTAAADPLPPPSAPQYMPGCDAEQRYRWVPDLRDGGYDLYLNETRIGWIVPGWNRRVHWSGPGTEPPVPMPEVFPCWKNLKPVPEC